MIVVGPGRESSAGRLWPPEEGRGATVAECVARSARAYCHNLNLRETMPMTIPTELKGIITTNPQILGGTPCFSGTRVPLATFLDHIEVGYSLDLFLTGYSSVRRERAAAVLHWLRDESRKSIGLEFASGRCFSTKTSVSSRPRSKSAHDLDSTIR
jgi:uncharacterized protein (DUF433 family)